LQHISANLNQLKYYQLFAIKHHASFSLFQITHLNPLQSHYFISLTPVQTHQFEPISCRLLFLAIVRMDCPSRAPIKLSPHCNSKRRIISRDSRGVGVESAFGTFNVFAVCSTKIRKVSFLDDVCEIWGFFRESWRMNTGCVGIFGRCWMPIFSCSFYFDLFFRVCTCEFVCGFWRVFGWFLFKKI
jgi:hypothetical protein